MIVEFMCKCIEDIEKLLTEKMIEQNPDAEILENVEFQNKFWMISSGLSYILSNPVLGKYKAGKSVKKFTMQAFPSYCPYCGEKLKKEDNN